MYIVSPFPLVPTMFVPTTEVSGHTNGQTAKQKEVATKSNNQNPSHHRFSSFFFTMMLRTLVGLAVLWTAQSQSMVHTGCYTDAECPPKQYCWHFNKIRHSRSECWCQGDWKGDDCDCSPSVTCNGNGHCENSECICTPGWVGPGCTISCEDARNCSGHGTCEQDGSCLCSDDWTGPSCNCSPSETCYGNGACHPTTLECTCLPGWTGVYCNMPCAPVA